MRPMNSLFNWAVDVAGVVARAVILGPVLLIGVAVLRAGRRRRL